MNENLSSKGLENSQIEDISSLESNHKGFLIILITKKIYCKIPVKIISSKKLKLQKFEDLKELEQTLSFYFQINKKSNQEIYDELLTSWKMDDKIESLTITPTDIHIGKHENNNNVVFDSDNKFSINTKKSISPIPERNNEDKSKIMMKKRNHSNYFDKKFIKEN